MLEQTYDELAATAGYVRRHIATSGPTQGLVTQLSGGSGQYLHGIVDWPAHGRFGYDMTATARTTVNALGVDVLRKVALVAEALGRPDAEVQAYRSDADALAGRMNATLRKPDGHLRRRPARRRHRRARTPASTRRRTPSRWASPRRPTCRRSATTSRAMGMKQGPMTVHWLVEALADVGSGDDAAELLTNEDDYGWAGWLAPRPGPPTGRGGVRPVKVAGGDGTVRYEVGSGTWSFVSR